MIIVTQATYVLQELTLQPLSTDLKLTHAPRDTIVVLAYQNRRIVLTACLLSSQVPARSKSASIASQGTTASMVLSKLKYAQSETTALSASKSQLIVLLLDTTLRKWEKTLLTASCAKKALTVLMKGWQTLPSMA